MRPHLFLVSYIPLAAKLGEKRICGLLGVYHFGHNTHSCCARGEANFADASLRAEATAAHLSLHAIAAIAH